ncbi:MAG: DUF4184 family protein [Verrucomicrobiota bacterium]|nr:DUF4184 family protein [Verrucomicrobiota bacterium]
MPSIYPSQNRENFPLLILLSHHRQTSSWDTSQNWTLSHPSVLNSPVPFTPSHPAIVLPLARWGLPLSPLVIGSIMPDMLYFIYLNTGANFGHTIPGLFQFDLPVGILFFLLFNYFCRLPLVSLFPESHQAALLNQKFSWSIPQLLLVPLCILLGAWSHILWDGITHVHPFTMRYMPFMAEPLFSISKWTIRPTNILQHLSTFLGGIYLLISYRKWIAPKKSPQPELPVKLTKQTRRLLLLLAILIATFCGIQNATGPHWRLTDSIGILYFARYFIVAWISAILILLLLYSLAWQTRAVLVTQRQRLLKR